MLKLKRFFNQNKKTILITVFAIAFIIVVIQIFNNVAKKKNEEKFKNTQNTIMKNDIYNSGTTVISGRNVNESKNKENTSIIENFIELCNDNKLQEAYDLLSDECKEVFYPTLEDFIKKYYSPIFTEKKICNAQSWMNSSQLGYTYKVNLTNDILSSGKVENGSQIEDYITIKDKGNESKLNINKYIGRKEINKAREKNQLKINVLSKDLYIDYEKYNIQVTNNNENTILLDSLKDVNSIYISGENEVKYSAYSSELKKVELTLNSKITKTITIKFNKMYNIERKILSMNFSNIIINYNESNESNSSKISMNIEL